MTKLIMIRGNSGSGKTTLANALKNKIDKKVMIISQDIVKREILNTKDGIEVTNLIIDLLRYGKKYFEIVILEGILRTSVYDDLFKNIISEFGFENIFAYYYDISFDETLRRHKMKKERFSFGEEEMRKWWKEKDYIGFIEEKKISSKLSLDETINRICGDIKKNSIFGD